jgi:hypothetical protein
LPESVVARVLEQLVAVPKLELHEHWEQFHELTQTMPRAVYRLLRSRVLLAATPQASEHYQPLPEGYDFALRMPGLATESDYVAICEELWQRVLNRQEPLRHDWLRLWQAVVLEDTKAWLPRLLDEVRTALSVDDLQALTQLLQWDGSLVVLRFPDLARAFLTRASALGGEQASRRIGAMLYAVTGPVVRQYSGGVLERQYDYVEVEAAKAAKAHATDPVLGPFYRWIAGAEQQDRAWQKAHAEAQMAALE